MTVDPSFTGTISIKKLREAIEKADSGLKDLKAEQKVLKKQNSELTKEMKGMGYESLKALSASIEHDEKRAESIESRLKEIFQIEE